MIKQKKAVNLQFKPVFQYKYVDFFNSSPCMALLFVMVFNNCEIDRATETPAERLSTASDCTLLNRSQFLACDLLYSCLTVATKGL